MMNFDIKVFGIEELTYKLNLLPVVMQNKIRSAQRVVSAMVVRIAKSLCPVDTGLLKSSIHGQWSTTNPMVRQVVADAPYAVFVEYGRHFFNQLDAQPFLRPALMAVGVRYTMDMEAAIASAISHVANGGGWLSSVGGGDSTSRGSGYSSGSMGGRAQSGSGSSTSSSGSSGGSGLPGKKQKNVGAVRVTDTPKGQGNAKLIANGDENSFARNKVFGRRLR